MCCFLCFITLCVGGFTLSMNPIKTVSCILFLFECPKFFNLAVLNSVLWKDEFSEGKLSLEAWGLGETGIGGLLDGCGRKS